MLFALTDYWLYRRRGGRFSRDFRQSVMGGAFDSVLPPKALALLQPGDLIFVETFESLTSWAVMYFTRSEVSHVAIYTGSGQIAHATFGGLVQEPIEALFGPNRRVLVCKPDIPEGGREKLLPLIRSQLGRPYGWYGVGRRGLRILCGRIWPLFRWTFMVDCCLSFSALDAVIFVTTGKWIELSLISLLYLTVVPVGWLFWRLRGYGREDVTPDMLLYSLYANGAQLVLDAYELSRQAGTRGTSGSVQARPGYKTESTHPPPASKP